MRTVRGYALIYLCALLDRVPTYENGRWYLCGQHGCALGLAAKGFQLLGDR